MPDHDDSTVTREYQHGLALGRAGSYFEAHEAFETAWRACAVDERDFFQGLVHVVVSAYQRERGKPVAPRASAHKAFAVSRPSRQPPRPRRGRTARGPRASRARSS
jgi:hypothetical protein